MNVWTQCWTPEELEKRNGRILELWEMGVPRQTIAELLGLTPARISQIVNNFGKGWK